MARLLTIGFETASLTAGYEVDSIGTPAATTATVTTGRSGNGTYSGYFGTSIFGGPNAQRQFLSSPTRGKWYFRFYFAFNQNPISSATSIFVVGTTSGTNYVNVIINQSGTLSSYVQGGTGTTFTTSSSLTPGRWYMIELMLDLTDGVNCSADIRIDGRPQGSFRATIANGLNYINFGTSVADGGSTAQFDDIAINDTTGSYQNYYPGPGRVILLRPSADGQSTAWTRTGGPVANWDCVDENPPNTGDYVSSNTLNQTDWYALSGITTSTANKINVVEVISGIWGNPTSASLQFQLQTQNSGVVQQSAVITPTGGQFWFNAQTLPRLAPITSYVDPQDSNQWTEAKINNIQVGQTITTTGSVAPRIFSMGVQVEVTEPALHGVSSISNISSIAIS